MDVIVGTAGHIDHGKTALIKALTGIDADRLPEEKRRGITVDLGFAELSIGDMHLGFVDVPGHERFVKNMLAGASGIDVVMLVIAADEGVMPQTREHFDICRLLGTRAGIVVLTKCDLVDAETLELSKLDASELVANSFLENAPLICVSSRTGDGIDELKKVLNEISSNVKRRDDRFVTRMPIDRSFSIKGFGAVVTGTLASGSINEGDEIELLPSKVKVRVRGLQTHGTTVKSANAGQRVAVNLGGIDHAKLTRGMLLSEPDILWPTQIFDAEIEVLQDAAKPLRSRQRVRVHIGTVEALARVQVLNSDDEIAAGETDFAQIRFETPLTAIPNERFVVRSYSPQVTIGGGVVIDTFAEKHRRKDIDIVRDCLQELSLASENNLETINILVRLAASKGLSFSDVQARTGLRKSFLSEAIDANVTSSEILDVGGRYIEQKTFETLLHSVESTLKDFHKKEPLAKGMSRENLRERCFAYLPSEIITSVITSLESTGKIVLDKEMIRLSSYQTTLSEAGAELSEKIFAKYEDAKLQVPKLEDALAESLAGTTYTGSEARKYFQLFLDSGEIVKVTEEFYFSKNAIDKLTNVLRQFANGTADRLIDVAKFKEIAGVSRKYAIPLLEFFDREKVTMRAGDKRIILK